MAVSFIEELNIYVNSTLAKVVATALVFCFILYHGLLHAVDGGDSCQRLLSDGRFQGSMVWQPYGCMLHSYSNIDSRRCMRYFAFLKQNNHIVFIGDSRIRQLYNALVRQIAVQDFPEPTSKHQDMKFNDSNLLLNIEFLWRPYMDEHVNKYLSSLKHSKEVPSLIVLGSGTHAILYHNGSEAALDEYKHNLTVLSSALDYLGNRTQVLWILQDPVVAERLAPHRKAITNDQIDVYNKVAMEILYETNAHIWSSSRLIAQGSLGEFSDGIHAGSVAIKYDTQILLNLYCNDNLSFNDGTCCSSREGFTLTQIIAFTTLCTCSFIMLVLALKHYFCGKSIPKDQSTVLMQEQQEMLLPSNSENHCVVQKPSSEGCFTEEFFTSVGKLGLIMGYFFICDRTNLFMKENKYFSKLNFWLPLGYVFALGLFFTEDTSHNRFLHRDMTDEWKGWMQLVILLYHMTGASQVLPIYMHIRVLVSSYLFLTGYGHFSYYWTGRDMGIVRYCQVMFRMNFITILLCLVMNRPYQFYYFVPLISFWYTVLHISLVTFPRISQPSHANSDPSPLNYFYSIIKFLCLGGFITILFLSQVFFEKVFVMRLWKFLFVNTDDDIHEWWFRWQLDRYSLLYGMVFALMYIGLSQYGLIDDKSGGNLLRGRLAILLALLAFTMVAMYSAFAYLCSNKPDCNEVHPYIVWVPILGYIILRNLLGIMRSRYSSFFAWFGRISLELFVCQYHIWLAADTHGVLVLIPSYPVANVLVTSFIFLCICHEIHEITNVLVYYVVPNESLKAIRNLGVFVFLLIAIAVHDGFF